MKYLLLFLLFFKDLYFRKILTKFSLYRKFNNITQYYNSTVSSLARSFMDIYHNFSSDSLKDFSYELVLYQLVPFDNIKVTHFLIGNKHVTAIFLAKYFAIRLFIGQNLKSLVNPVVKELKRLIFNSLNPYAKLRYLDRSRMLNFLTYRSSLFKYIIFKNFCFYKISFIKNYKNFKSFYNFYLLWFFCFFYFEVPNNSFFFIGLCKSFFFRKHSYNLFFNNNFNTIYKNVFNFFSLVILNFSKTRFIYFRQIFDELFNSLNLILFHLEYFNLEFSGYKVAAIFFNKALIYHY